MTKTIDVFGVTLTWPNGELTVVREHVVIVPGVDYGSDPVLDPGGEPTGYVTLVPSGRVVLAADAAWLTTPSL